MEPGTLIALVSLGFTVGNIYHESVKERNQFIRDLKDIKYDLIYSEPDRSDESIVNLLDAILYYWDAAKSNRVFKACLCPIKYEASSFVSAARMYLATKNTNDYNTMLNESYQLIDAIIEFLE